MPLLLALGDLLKDLQFLLFLSGVSAARSEALTQSKDPLPALCFLR
jgi:hypothetical protein